MEAKLAVLGGTFNPVHVGHLVMAQDALEEFELDQVLFVPGGQPPHKANRGLPDARHRVAMLEAALEGDPRFEISRLEVERDGVSYSVDTVEDLRARHPQARLYFIIGSDTLFELHTWKRIYDLLGLCEFITMVRPGFSAVDVTSESTRLVDPWPERLARNLTTGHLVDISSTDIRMRVAEGLSIRYLVPEAVGMYIYEHKLYLA